MNAEELLRAGRLDEALTQLKDQVRDEPTNAADRVFLFQLLSVMGRWDQALTQLNVAADLDAANGLMAQVCREALACELLRVDIFAGRRSPLVFGEPEPWVGWMIQALQSSSRGDLSQAEALRAQALAQADAVAGTVNGQAFEWIADADARLGPIVEAVVNGRYYWIPFSHISRIHLDPPTDLRDLVWMPAQLRWTNGGEAPALIPTRYPGSASSGDSAIQLARKTDWIEQEVGAALGLGQRLFATDQDDYPILDIREITLGSDPGRQGVSERPDGGPDTA